MYALHYFVKNIRPLNILAIRPTHTLERSDVDTHQRTNDDMYYRICGRTYICYNDDAYVRVTLRRRVASNSPRAEIMRIVTGAVYILSARATLNQILELRSKL